MRENVVQQGDVLGWVPLVGRVVVNPLRQSINDIVAEVVCWAFFSRHHP